MNVNEIKQILREENLQLTKSLGQNFLHDANQLRKIADAAKLTKTDQVLEIGPGLGPLTEVLLDRAGLVVAIEKDQRLAEFLRERLGSRLNLRIVNADALDFVRERKLSASLDLGADRKLVSNLPYSVASPILVELALGPSPPSRMVVTLQLEVADRLRAGPRSKDYGVLSLLVQSMFVPGDWFKIPPGCFFPPPNVDSACLTLNRREHPLLPASQVPVFAKIVKRSFSQRRKMMVKLLKADWPMETIQNAFASLNLSPQIRGEAVTLEQYVELTRLFARPN